MGIFSDINRVQLLGNITMEPEVRYTQNGVAVMTLNMATNRSYKQNDEWKDDTEYHTVVVWANKAESLNGRVIKGTRVIVDGRLQTRSYTDKNGVKKYKTEIVAQDVILIDRYNKKDNPTPQNQPAQTSNNNEDIIDPDDLPF